MVNVICDTSFLIHLANNRIINLDRLDVEIGQLSFLVPTVVNYELLKLKTNTSKIQEILQTLDYVKNFKTIEITGTYADDAIIEYALKNNDFIATMDKELKNKIKNIGKSVITFSKNRIILES